MLEINNLQNNHKSRHGCHILAVREIIFAKPNLRFDSLTAQSEIWNLKSEFLR